MEVNLDKGDRMLICCIYRSPNSNENNNNDLLLLLEEISDKKYPQIVLLGDFNLPMIDWNSDPPTSTSHYDKKFIERIQDCFWNQLVKNPTRIRGTNRPSTLDLVFTEDPQLIEYITHESPLGASDHCILDIKCICNPHISARMVKKYFIDRTDYNKMATLLSLDWEELLPSNTDVNTLWTTFEKVLQDAQEHSIPHKLINANSTKTAVPKDNLTVRKIRKKHRTWTRYIETNDQNKLKEYKKIRNQVRNTTRRMRKQVEQNIALDIKKNPKKFWRYVNSKSKSQDTIPDLKLNTNSTDSIATTDKEKAQALSDFFASVLKIEPDDAIPDTWHNNIQTTLSDITITEEMVKKKLKELKISKSPGPDQLFPKILQSTANQITKPLTTIFNRSLQERTVPSSWKIGKISAIHKKGPRNICGNYRPISLTSIVSKIMESIIRDEIMDYLSRNNLISDKQYGFLPGRSTTSQLLKIVDEWTKALDDGHYIESIYLDIEKAFDTVPHKRLLHKLNKYGLQGNILGWLQSFLHDRKQFVCVNGESSDQVSVTSGVPQGSVLGPSLFVIYINDLPAEILSSIFMFADDTKIYHIHNGASPDNIQRDLDTLQNWSDTWLIKFHPEKCNQLKISRPSMTNELPVRKLYKTVNNDKTEVPISQVTSEKDLGITFDSHLSFKLHIDQITKKASQMMGIIRRTFSELNPSIFTPLYKCLVRSRLEYGQSIWSPYLIADIKKLENVQRNATRQINSFKNLSYPERLQKLKLPTLYHRRKRGDMIETFKIISGKYNSETVISLKMDEGGRRGHPFKLFKNRTNKLDLRKYAFPQRIVDQWNSLPVDVVNANNVNTFKNRLDKFWATSDDKYNFPY